MVDCRSLKLLYVVDKHTRKCLAIEVGPSMRAQDVVLTLSRLIRLWEMSHQRVSRGTSDRPHVWAGGASW